MARVGGVGVRCQQDNRTGSRIEQIITAFGLNFFQTRSGFDTGELKRCVMGSVRKYEYLWDGVGILTAWW